MQAARLRLTGVPVLGAENCGEIGHSVAKGGRCASVDIARMLGGRVH